MDPVTTAIVAALAAGAGKVAEKAIVDAYDGLKAILKRKFREQGDLAEAIKELEAKPESDGRKTTLREEVVNAKADQDPDVLKAALALLDQIKAHPGGEQHIQTAIGSYIAQADRSGTASVKVNQPKE
jgi:hypothetical protein